MGAELVSLRCSPLSVEPVDHVYCPPARAKGGTKTGTGPISLVLVVFRGYCQFPRFNCLISVALELVQWIGKLRFCH